VNLWRICRSTFQVLDGEGARLYGGRWNPEGVAVVYLSTSLELAALEYLVHLDVSMVPGDLVSVEVEVSDQVSSERVERADLPPDWNTASDHPSCIDLGADWIRRGESCLLFVPSAVIPRSWNVLLNPSHQEARGVSGAVEPFAFDRRLLE
jgi:RES domain-containing protein